MINTTDFKAKNNRLFRLKMTVIRSNKTIGHFINHFGHRRDLWLWKQRNIKRVASSVNETVGLLGSYFRNGDFRTSKELNHPSIMVSSIFIWNFKPVNDDRLSTNNGTQLLNYYITSFVNYSITFYGLSFYSLDYNLDIIRNFWIHSDALVLNSLNYRRHVTV